MKQKILWISCGIFAEDFHTALIVEVCTLIFALCSGFAGSYPAVESIVPAWHL